MNTSEIRSGLRFNLPNDAEGNITEVFANGFNYHTFNMEGECVEGEKYMLKGTFISEGYTLVLKPSRQVSPLCKEIDPNTPESDKVSGDFWVTPRGYAYIGTGDIEDNPLMYIPLTSYTSYIRVVDTQDQ